MKVFCVSDIHGHYTELINCLNKAGYDENNENHLLVVLGDLFDRGTESKKVFNYLYRLSFNNKAICSLASSAEYTPAARAASILAAASS